MDAAAIAARGAALLDVASTVTGVERTCCQWENDPRVAHNGALVLLRDLPETTVGTDSVVYDYAPNADPLLEMTPAVQGHRVVVVQLDVEVHDQTRGANAQAVASRVAARMRWPSVQPALAAVGLAFTKAENVVNTDYELDGHFVSRRTVDLRFNAVDSETDAAGATSYIATVVSTAAITHPDGSAVDPDTAPGGTLP